MGLGYVMVGHDVGYVSGERFDQFTMCQKGKQSIPVKKDSLDWKLWSFVDVFMPQDSQGNLRNSGHRSPIYI